MTTAAIWMTRRQMKLPDGPFDVVCADPPWNFKANSVEAPGRNARRHYETMSLAAIATRKNAEVCLLGKRGRSLRQSASVREVIIDPRREHSRKPEVFRDRVEQYVGPDKRILELFARSSRPGWSTWGNEAEKFDARAA